MPAYKNEKLNTWYAKFNYKDWTGKTKQKKKEGFKTQREAKEFERNFLNHSQADCDILFSNLILDYLDDCKSRLKPTTIDNKKYIINEKMLPYFGNMAINSITPAAIRKWQNQLLSDENNYTQTYLRTVHSQLSAVFNYAVKYYNLSKNPATLCGSIGKNHTDTIHFWTLAEFKQFMSTVKDPVSYAAFNILFWTGIRIGELLALTLNDFDFIAQTLSITKNYARLKNEDIILPPKTPKSKRIITLPAFLCDIVQAYSKKYYDLDPNSRLFPKSKYFFHYEKTRCCKLSGVKNIRLHDLRHSHASLLIELGYSPILIKERLGHEKIETTLQTYSHLYPNKHEEVADKLNELNK